MTSVSAVNSITIAQILMAINNPQPTNINTGTMVIDGTPLTGSGTPAGSTIAAGSATSIDTFA